MATIYSHNASDKVLILEPREGFQRKFDVGSWTELRIGFYWNNVGINTPTSSYPDETVTQVTKADTIAIGLKDSTTSILPGYSGSYFIGITVTGSHSPALDHPNGGTGRYRDGTGDSFWGTGFYGTSSYYGAQSLSMIEFQADPNTGNYASVYSMRFIINNSGSASQTISMYCSNTKDVDASGTSYYSSSYLNQAMQNANWSNVSTFTWNDGVSAYPIPDSLWVRTPFYYNRLRISTMRIVKYS